MDTYVHRVTHSLFAVGNIHFLKCVPYKYRYPKNYLLYEFSLFKSIKYVSTRRELPYWLGIHNKPNPKIYSTVYKLYVSSIQLQLGKTPNISTLLRVQERRGQECWGEIWSGKRQRFKQVRINDLIFVNYISFANLHLARMAAEVLEGVRVRDVELKLLRLLCTAALAEKEPCSFSIKLKGLGVGQNAKSPKNKYLSFSTVFSLQYAKKLLLSQSIYQSLWKIRKGKCIFHFIIYITN